MPVYIVQASETFLHLYCFEHPFKHPHLVSYNSSGEAGEFNSNARHRVPFSSCQPFLVGDRSPCSALNAFLHMYV